MRQPRPEICFTVEGLRKIYPSAGGDVAALRGIDLEVRRGELIVLLGPSGSGKSTLLNILGGLDSASGGRVMFGDRDITRLSDRALTAFRRASVGFIFQFFNLIPSLTARENVALITEIAEHPMSPDEALRKVGLGDRGDHFPAELSGGEQQRVAVARAVAKRPEILLCDEPTGSLDSDSGRQVLQALVDSTETLGATTLIVSHNTGIARIADRIIRFHDGAIKDIEINADKRRPADIEW